MWRILRRYPLVVGLLMCYGFHLILKFGRIPVPIFLSHYFADLLCMPLLLSVVVIGMRWVKSLPNLTLNLPMVVCAVLAVGFVFEYWLPQNSKRYTADGLDLLMYGVGGGVFWVFQATLVPKEKGDFS
jgi:hypothetical protein